MDESFRGKIQFPPRLLKPRAHFEFISKIVLSIIVVVGLLIILDGLFILSHYFKPITSIPTIGHSVEALNRILNYEIAVIALGYLVLFLMVLITIYFKFFFGISGREFQAFKNYLLIIKNKKEEKIYYEEIKSINLGASGPFYFFTIGLKNGKKRKFSTVVERVEYIIDSVLKYNPRLMSWAEFLKFRSSMVLSDHRFARFRDIYYGPKAWSTYLILVLIPAFFLVSLFVVQSGKMVIYSMFLHIFIGLKLVIICNVVLWLIQNFIFSNLIEGEDLKRFNNNPRDKKRNMERESKTWAFLYAGNILCISLFYYFIFSLDLNRFEIGLVSKVSTHLDVKVGDVYLLDTRFNCVKCNYEVKVGDKVIYHKLEGPEKHLGFIQVIDHDTNKITLRNANPIGERTIAGDDTVQGYQVVQRQIYGKLVQKWRFNWLGSTLIKMFNLL